MNAVDIVCIAVLAVSVILGMYRGFINGVLSLAALAAAIRLSFLFSGQLADYLRGNETLVATLMYYTDAVSRIGSLDFSLMTVGQVSQGALSQILEKAKLPEAFERAFLGEFRSAGAGTRVSAVLSQSIVNASISILSFLICFAVFYIAALFVIHLISYVFELPVLRHLDSLAGGIFGLIRGYITLVIIFLLVPIVLAVAPIEQISRVFEESTLRPMFDSRLIFSILGIGG